MSQIASFYLLKDGRRRELSDGGCSGDVYMAIWDYCEDELGIDCRVNAPRTDDALDCVLIDNALAEALCVAFMERNVTPSSLATELEPDWDLPVEVLESGIQTFFSHLELVEVGAVLLYEMT